MWRFRSWWPGEERREVSQSQDHGSPCVAEEPPKLGSLFTVGGLRQRWRMLLSSLLCLSQVHTNVQSGTHFKDDRDYFYTPLRSIGSGP